MRPAIMITKRVVILDTKQVKSYNSCRISTNIHMSTYSTISIDTATKNRAAKRAKKDRMNISFITRLLLNDYADGKITVGSQMAITENGFTPAFEEAVLAAENEECSEAFEGANDAIAFLHKESKRAA
ncbi:hypothetical protein IPG41_04675 [Candidatus Peregrinibacteria bacterium]|nr:MAG: hypothetical protein IPG41_04675 [Candidatus Peregrinibacteria bacterium]